MKTWYMLHEAPSHDLARRCGLADLAALVAWERRELEKWHDWHGVWPAYAYYPVNGYVDSSQWYRS
jgi:hypothetical protein